MFQEGDRTQAQGPMLWPLSLWRQGAIPLGEMAGGLNPDLG